MKLLDFINAHDDWQNILSKPPYNLTIKQDQDYYLLKYDMIASDLNLLECREARGAIVRFSPVQNQWICVCRALDKFGNYGEPYAATNQLDWTQGVDIQEKIDGSICRVWYDRNEWHLSTNNVIDAKTATCGNSTFFNTFCRVLGTSFESFCLLLNEKYCYWFELVSHDNPIVIRYAEEAIYYLGARNMQTLEECEKPFIAANLSFPKHYTYHSLAECIEAAHHLGDDEEGYVVVGRNKEDGSFLRIKIKGDEYLKLHKMRGNGALTIKQVCEMWQDDSLDDYIAFFPYYNEFIHKVTNCIVDLKLTIDIAWEQLQYLIDDRKAFAAKATQYEGIVASCLFALLSNKTDNSLSFLKTSNIKPLVAYITNIIGNKEVQLNEGD